MKLFAVTKIGKLVDTEVQLFQDHENALAWLDNEWHKLDLKSRKHVCEDCWQTDDDRNQKIEWQIHRKEV